MRKRTASFELTTMLVTMTACGIASTAADTAAVRFIALDPVVLQGAGFKAGERVRVVLSINGAERVSSIRASADGTFKVSFADSSVRDRCNADIWAMAFPAVSAQTRAKLPQSFCPLSL